MTLPDLDGEPYAEVRVVLPDTGCGHTRRMNEAPRDACACERVFVVTGTQWDIVAAREEGDHNNSRRALAAVRSLVIDDKPIMDAINDALSARGA